MPSKFDDEIRRLWKPRKSSSHKGDFGRVFILAGSRGFSGAAHLSGMAAVRSGAGLVTVGVPQSIYNVTARREAEVMVKPFSCGRDGALSATALSQIQKFLKTQDAAAAGPGLSRSGGVEKILHALVKSSDIPLVLDADGLNAFEGQPGLLAKAGAPLVLTPHEGEFKRLFGNKPAASEAGRKREALETARRYNITLVLKGHRTVVAAADGQVFVNKTGNPGMATGGTGDVLTGMIVALLGQKFSVFDAACLGVYFHGLAGDLAARKTGQVSLAAGDLLEHLPQAFKKVLRF